MPKKKNIIVKMEPQTVKLFAVVLQKLKPPPPLTISQWADKYRVLSSESSAEPGRWHTDKAPYQRAIMDAIGDPHVREVVVMSAAQIGKTDAFILNVLAYYMDYAPAPIMCMVQRIIGKPAKNPKPTRWKSKNGIIEYLYTMSAPSASSMHSTVWREEVEPESEIILQDRLRHEVEKILMQAGGKKK